MYAVSTFDEVIWSSIITGYTLPDYSVWIVRSWYCAHTIEGRRFHRKLDK